MARKPDSLSVSGSTETIIGTGVTAKGTLVSEADIMIDGNFSGDIKASGNVTLGANAVVKADVSAENVVIAGQLKGDITSVGETSIAESGRVYGNIITALLSISSGAVFIGSSKMIEPAAPIPHPSEDNIEEVESEPLG